MTEEELTSLRETHTFEVMPQEPEWLHPEMKVLFDTLEAKATQILTEAYDLARQSEQAYQREIPRARRAIEPIRREQRELMSLFVGFAPPMILAKPKPTETTCATSCG